MKHVIRTKIEIHAPASVVWELLIDLDAYHRWNPFIIEAKGRIAPDAHVEVSPQLTGKRQTTFWPIVTRYVEGVEFAWTGSIIHPWFAAGEHRFHLDPVAADRVVLEHDEVFYGLGGPLIGLLAGKLTKRGFVAMNEALKKEAEALQRSKATTGSS